MFRSHKLYNFVDFTTALILSFKSAYTKNEGTFAVFYTKHHDIAEINLQEICNLLK